MNSFRKFPLCLIAICSTIFACATIPRSVNSISQGKMTENEISFVSPRAPKDSPAQDYPPGRFSAAPPMKAPMQPFATKLMSLDHIKELGLPSTGLVPGGLAVKFIIDLRESTPKIYFINGNYSKNGRIPDSSKYHYYFAETYLNMNESIEEFNSHNYFEPDIKKHSFVQGTLQTYEYNNATLYGAQLYPQDVLREEGILLMMKTLSKAVSKELRPLGFVQQNDQQTIHKVSNQLEKLETKVFTLETLLGNLTYVPMNQGIAKGFLRVFPKNINALAPTDIAFFDKIPLDLSVVSGVITVQVQDPGSHINLKSKERKTPNMVLRSSEMIEKLKAMDGQPISLEVLQSRFEIKKIKSREVEDFYKKRLNSQVPMKLTLDSKAKIMTYDDMCPQSASGCILSLSKFGGKAAKLGFLAHPKVLGMGSAEQKKFNYRLTPYGFAVPLQNYMNFINDPQNSELKAKLNDFIVKESGTRPYSSAERASAIEILQTLFYKAHLPEKNLDEVKEAIKNLSEKISQEYPGVTLKKIKVRSSANAEDIPEFDGAGLHSSFGAKIDKPATTDDQCATERNSDNNEESDIETKLKMQPENLSCAIKGVYASFWNQRAVEERSFRRIDHTTVAMGLAIVPSYSFLKKQGLDETANSVVVTRVINSAAMYGYTVSTQEGDNLATNPFPGTQAELCVATFLTTDEPIGLSFLRYARSESTSEVRTTSILQANEMKDVIQLSQKVEQQYCYAKKDYYNNQDCSFVTADIDKPRSLDLEFKFLGDQHQILCKQVREFSGK
jgi:hypothetical protein